jgi:flavin reductase (DIM6/NTAB) family NADH-FMN oxidoreductase RutF
VPSKLRLITEPAPERASAAEFADAMSALASGVVVVTCRHEGRPWGTTVTAFASVAAHPPTVLVSLGSSTTAARAIAATRRFGVSILAGEQLAVARHASAPGTAKFLERFTDTRGATPIVAGALAHLDCELVEETRLADHTVFFGRVRAASAGDAGAPLLYHRREYRTLAEPDAADTTTERSTRCLAN